METRTELGWNRTGLQTSPLDAAALTDGATALASQMDGLDDLEGRDDLQVRQAYASEADPLGSVPLPLTVTGVVKSGVDLLTGNRPQVLMDKLGERLAFERGGVRLYDSLLVKCRAMDSGLTVQRQAQLAMFRDQEAEHFALVENALRDLGGDPTAQTPCADLVGIKSQGLVQAMNDPRTSFLQSLHVMLDAELIDNAGWELLIQLAGKAGHAAIAEQFTAALEQEAQHLRTLRELVAELTLSDADATAEALAGH